MNQFCLMIFSCFLLLCHFMPIAASTAITKEHVTPGLETYVNEEKKFSIEYPSDWMRIIDVPEFDLFLFATLKNDSQSGVNMSVISKNLEDSMTLEQLYSEAISYFSDEDTNIKSGEISLNGIPGKWILYTLSIQGVEIQVLQYLIVAQNMEYIISCGATGDDFMDYFSEFETIASSFRLL